MDDNDIEAQVKSVSGFQRLEIDETPVWVAPEVPDWIVPNRRGDQVLRALAGGASPAEAAGRYARTFDVHPGAAAAQVRLFLERFPGRAPEQYAGRAARLELNRLRECWLHVTNRCNLTCTHCMFASSPHADLELATPEIIRVIDEASALGCELFFLTGGEPLIHPGFAEVVARLAGLTRVHTVIMSNGLAVPRVREVLETLPRERFHFQVSMDGPPTEHDRLRGEGAYARVTAHVRDLLSMGFPVSLAMAVDRGLVAHMEHLVEAAAALGVGSVHYLWYFGKGKGDAALAPDVPALFEGLRRAADAGAELAVEVDNVEILRSQVFSLPGTRYDLTNAGWQSLAVGPDGVVYPTAALVFEPELAAGDVEDGLEQAWRDGAALDRLRHASLVDAPEYRRNPLAFIIGGGDIDHSWVAGRSFTGHDPYVDLYNRTALWLMTREAGPDSAVDFPALRARMGERLEVCGEEDAAVGLAHSNCVLSLPGTDGHTLAKAFYSEAADRPNEEIANPVGYEDAELSHVPEAAQVRSYGCGSPVLDANLGEGETVVDLGCGAGIECFIAARKVGPSGKVVGVDMLDEMLELARQGADQVRAELGWDNVELRKGLLEELPLPDASVDVVLSNCVINLSVDKRRTFREVLRALRPGGRLVISDVVSDGDIPLDIRYNEKLRGECLGGAMRQEELFAMLADVGFAGATLLKRFPYRTVRGYRFYSVTYAAVRPGNGRNARLVYRGPFAAAVLEDGTVLPRGRTVSVELGPGYPNDPSAFVLDTEGAVTNVDLGAGCACFVPPDAETAAEPVRITDREGCMVCGAPLEYMETARRETCSYCRRSLSTSTLCEAGHFVCDDCHSRDAIEVITRLCLSSTETDLITLFERVRHHPSIPMHGPEYHALVPAVIVAVARHSGLVLGDEYVRTAVERGRTVAGGACAFLGACGAALGVGAAFSVILGASPYMGDKRKLLHEVTTRVLGKIGELGAARCCQRDSWLALKEAAALSEEVIGVRLRAERELICRQSSKNRDCLRSGCPLWPANLRRGHAVPVAPWSRPTLTLPTLPTVPAANRRGGDREGGGD